MSKALTGTLTPGKPVAIIMAGGSGTRFWPLSRENFPKQFLPLGPKGESLISLTAERIRKHFGVESILVVTAENQRHLVEEHLPGIAILAEPQPRNTAACLGFASAVVQEVVGDVPMVSLPSDHLVTNISSLLAAYTEGMRICEADRQLCTFGIKPTRPETAYGYIEAVDKFSATSSALKVLRFVEKPEVKTAESYLAAGNFYWNSGMFVWRPSVLLEELSTHLPSHSEVVVAVAKKVSAGDTVEQIAQSYASLPSVSIDVGVMERTHRVVMIPAGDLGWSDVGSWDSWIDSAANIRQEELNLNQRAIEIDSLGNNVGLGNQHLFLSCNNSSAVGSKRLISMIGTKDLIVIDSDDAILVCHRDQVQSVKKMVEHLKKIGRSDLL